MRVRPDWQGKYAGRVLRPQIGRGGYAYHILSDGGKKKTLKAHRLVCAAFNGPPPDSGLHCAHRDGDVTNNTPANLYWATPKENTDDRERHGRTARGERSGALLHPERVARGERHWTKLYPHLIARGDSHPFRKNPEIVRRGSDQSSAKLSEGDVAKIRAEPRWHGSGKFLSQKFGVSMGLISAIRKGRVWRHLQ